MKKLKIAVFVSSHFTVPPPKGIIYAPMDVAVSVGRGLKKLGHKVDFYAPLGSRIKGLNIVDLGIKALKQNGKILKDPNVRGTEIHKIFNLWDQYFLSEIYKRAEKGEYDIVHIHPIDRALPLARAFSNVPTVYTIHDPIFPWRAEIFKMFESKNQHFISISDAQRKPAPNLNYAATIYNGVDLKTFSFAPAAGDYLLFAGRLIKEKGVAEAIQASIKAGGKLIIAGVPSCGDYWNKEVKPYLGSQIKYVGEISRNKLYKYYQRAKAVLVPIQWEEPFGLVLIESMACGTPVIAFDRGSVPEIIADGKTGFIVKNVNEMAKAIKKVDLIDRSECRRLVERKFSAQIMADNYEEIFLDLAK